MAHVIPSTPPQNRVSPEALHQLRSTQLDLPGRISRLLRAGTHRTTAESILPVLDLLQEDLSVRLRDVQNWDAGHRIRTTNRTRAELTLANATSWAVWEQDRTLLPLTGHETHSDVQDDDPRWTNLLHEIHADVFFISINWGGTGKDQPVDRRSYRFDSDFLNFHEHVPHHNEKDQLLTRFHRFIAPYTDAAGETEEFCAEHLWGGYLTDLYKGIPTPDQRGLDVGLTRDQRRVLRDVMLQILEEELRILSGPVKPVLACIGRKVEGPVRRHFEMQGYTVVYLPHYSGSANGVQLPARREAFRTLDHAVGALRGAAG